MASARPAQSIAAADSNGQMQPVHVPARPIGEEEVEQFSLQDLLLPHANILRSIRSSVPDDAKISKETAQTISESVSEFISFVTSEAWDHAASEDRKMMSGEDIVWALSNLGLDSYEDALVIYLARYRELAQSQRPEVNAKRSRNKKAAKQKAAEQEQSPSPSPITPGPEDDVSVGHYDD